MCGDPNIALEPFCNQHRIVCRNQEKLGCMNSKCCGATDDVGVIRKEDASTHPITDTAGLVWIEGRYARRNRASGKDLTVDDECASAPWILGVGGDVVAEAGGFSINGHVACENGLVSRFGQRRLHGSLQHNSEH